MNAIVNLQPAPAPSSQTFEFEGEAFRTSSEANGALIFRATDVARALGYRDAGNLARNIDPDELTTHTVSGGLGEGREVLYITEAGLYRAIMLRRTGKKLHPQVAARIARFQRWVTHDVIPSIRRTGSYSAPGAPSTAVGLLEALRDPEQVLALIAHHAQQTLAARAETEAERSAHAQTHQQLEDAGRLLDVASRRAETTGRALVVATQRIAAQEPIVERHRRIVEADGALSVTDTANIMGVPRSELYEFLRDREHRTPWLYGGEEGKGPERPFRERVKRRQLRVRLVRVTHSDGTVEQVGQPLVTPKGLDRLMQVFPHWAAERARKAAGRPVDLFAPPEPPPEPEDA